MKSRLTLRLVAAIAALFLFANDRVVAQGDGLTSELATWGKTIDPDGDCKFFAAEGMLLITVPGSERPHDLAADINTSNAPRVLQPAQGDFTLQVQVDGRFMPGDASTQPGRGGYNGAGLVAVLDPKNVVTLARAVLQHPGKEPASYVNFEIRTDGKLQRIGLTGDHRVPQDGPLFLRLERRGQKMHGAVSTDGSQWTTLDSKEIPADWKPELHVGVVAISTSKAEFNPRFSKLQLLK